jgi:hypothetical protein
MSDANNGDDADADADEGETDDATAPDQPTSRTPPGCVVKPTLLAAACLTGGIYLINRSESVGGIGRTAAVVLIFLGGILSIPFLMIVLGLAVRWYFTRRITSALKDVLDPAREMVQRNKAIFAERHEYRDATDADFAGLDRDWYESTTRELQSSGHRRLGDVVNQTIERAGLLTVIRRMTSADGTTMLGLFHFAHAPGTPGARDFRTVDVETEFTDGTFLLTSNTAQSDLTTTPPALHRSRHPTDTPVADLLRSHESEKATLLASKAGVSCVIISSAEEMMESQHRQQVIKAAFRKGIGYLDPEEVRRIAKLTVPDDEAAQAIAVASADIARREET